MVQCNSYNLQYVGETKGRLTRLSHYTLTILILTRS